MSLRIQGHFETAEPCAQGNGGNGLSRKAHHLVVVESPAKARTIEKFLGPGFEVLASYGHVRDLVPREGAVEPSRDFEMHYEPIEKAQKHLSALGRAMKKADALFLATDPDREGEAIAWHVTEFLKEREALDGKPVYRVVFHEITRRAIQEAVENARDISMALVNAQQARRALDYLVGFNLSPLLWKKIRRGLSAGRVQSPALRMIVEREEEIERFEAREYWSVDANLAERKGHTFSARLTHSGGKKLNRFSISHEAEARAIVERAVSLVGGSAREQEALAPADDGAARSTKAQVTQIDGGRMRVVRVEKKQRRRNPPPPFMTSTLQQEAVRKLGFTAQRTMRVAQQLYEGVEIDGASTGLITYMRTDSLNLASEARDEIRDYIRGRFGAEDVPAKARVYKTRSKNAQEAHEAIRPTSAMREPLALRNALGRDQYRLYRLIWTRAVACQMQHALIDTVGVDFSGGDSPQTVEEAALLFRATGSTIARQGFLAVYDDSAGDEAAEKEKRLPALSEGEVVTVQCLRSEQHFTEPPPRYSEATLIRTLEEYGIGRPSTYAAIIQTLMNREYVEIESRRFHPTDIGRVVNGYLTEHFSSYVEYEFTARLEDDLDAISRGEREWKPLMREFWESFEQRVKQKEGERGRPAPRELGVDPKSAREVTVRMGRYGPYVQIGTAEDEEKPVFAGLRPGQRMNTITLEEGLLLFKLPRSLGETPDGEAVSVGIGRFGPYVRFGSKFASLGPDDDPYQVELERALSIVDAKKKADAARHIKSFEGGEIQVLNGRYGPYVTDGKKNARVPKGRDPAELTLEECRELLEAAPAKRRRTRGRTGKS